MNQFPREAGEWADEHEKTWDNVIHSYPEEEKKEEEEIFKVPAIGV